MLKLSYMDRPNIDEYYNNISRERRVFFNHEMLDKDVWLEKALMTNDMQIAINELRLAFNTYNVELGELSKFGTGDDSKRVIYKYFEKYVPEQLRYMFTNKNGCYSLDARQVLQPMSDKGLLPEFLTPFMSYKKHKKAAGDMTKLLTNSFRKTDVDNIISLGYSWTKALSNRMYTRGENIQGINKTFLTAMCGPSEDYLLVWGDLDQIDLRVAYYTTISENPEDDKIFRETQDKYEAIARIIDRNLGREFNLNDFKENRKKYKTGILARCYGQSLSSLMRDIGDAEFAKMLDAYYLGNKRYMSRFEHIKYIASIENSINAYTYFGNLCRVPLTDLRTIDQKLDRLLNVPIQSTSNDIIMHIVNDVVRKFRELGYDESMFRVYMIRHDEPIFLMHKSLLPHLHLIQEDTVIQVDDWGPLTMSLDIGQYYKISENEKYAEYFKDMSSEDAGALTPRPYVYDAYKKSEDNCGDLIDADISYDGKCLKINDTEVVRQSGTDKLFIHNALAKYCKDKGKSNGTFNCKDMNDLTMLDIYVNGVYLYFKEEVKQNVG